MTSLVGLDASGGCFGPLPILSPLAAAAVAAVAAASAHLQSGHVVIDAADDKSR